MTKQNTKKDLIKNIVVVGGGTAGWMSAAALSHALGSQLYNITLVESEEIGTVGVGEATVPMIKLFNKFLGIDEDEFVRATQGTFKLGIEFINWRKAGHSYFHPFGNFGVDMGGVSFTHYWLRWREQGGNVAISEFNAESASAKLNKFARVPPQNGAKTLPDVNYAYHFDATLYAAFLRKFAEKRGVKRVEGKISQVLQASDTGYIQGLRLENGESLSGDFFIDCTGFRGLLIEQTLQAGYNDWSRWLPVNSAVAVPTAKHGELLPFTKATAHEAGWQWRIPLQHRTGNGHVYCDQYTSHETATETLMANLDAEPLAEPRQLRFLTGIRNKSWVNNCVAIGLASGFLEPLESTSIHLIQRAIFKLLSLFPKHGISTTLAERFNRDITAEYVEVKDFLIAHYKVTEREDSEFWRYVKHMPVPDSLAEKLEVFKERGEIVAAHDNFFRDVNWFAVLFGQGLDPEGYHPVADTLSEDELLLRLSKVRSGVQKRTQGMPQHAEYLEKSGLAPL